MLKLKIIEGVLKNSIFELEEGVVYEVRRKPVLGIPSNIDRKKNIFLDDDEVSKLHAKFTSIAGDLVVEDLNSTNGVYLNGKKITKFIANVGDQVKVGSTVFTLIEDSEVKQRTFVGKLKDYSKFTHDFKKLSKVLEGNIIFNPELAKVNKKELPKDVQEIFENIKTIYTDKKEKMDITGFVKSYFFEVDILDKNIKINFYREKIIIGRKGDLIIEDESLSREHAELSVLPNGLFKVKDLGSQNGTFVNGSRISVAEFKEKDILKVGDTRLKLTYLKEDF
jgi:pSer/pThr/pTyr-binding forkhead associated (FHA) protein